MFASGWYIDVDQFTVDFVSAVVDLFRSEGLEGTLQSLADGPESPLGGIADTAVAYNVSATVKGERSIFIADPNGAIVLHFNPSMVGLRLETITGPEALEVGEEGVWLTSESMRIWVVKDNGWVFGAGSYQGVKER